MKRFNGIERAALLLAAVLFFGGASMVIWPRAGVVPHPFTINGYGAGGTFEDRFTASGAQKRGLIAMLLGAGLAGITIYNGKS
jgi:hypothetical protein